jgi:hypothetical protein
MNINLKEDIKPISYIKTNAVYMINYINDNKNPIIVTQHGEAGGGGYWMLSHIKIWSTLYQL